MMMKLLPRTKKERVENLALKSSSFSSATKSTVGDLSCCFLSSSICIFCLSFFVFMYDDFFLQCFLFCLFIYFMDTYVHEKSVI